MQALDTYVAWAQEAPHRLKTRLRVYIGRINETAGENAAFSSADAVYYSDFSTLITGPVPEKTYTTWEPGRWICGGGDVLASRRPALRQGYCSLSPAGADGTFAAPPGVFMQFSQVFTIEGLTLSFDPSHNDWPEQIHIRATRGGAVITEEDAYPDTSEWAWGGVIGAVDRLELTFIRMRFSGRRARLQQVLLGDGIDMTPRLMTATCRRDVDPASLDNPLYEFEFYAQNHDKKFDPEAPNGVWAKLLDRNAVNLEFAPDAIVPKQWRDLAATKWRDTAGKRWQDLTKRTGLRVPAGLFYLTSKSKDAKGVARFPCVGMLSLASDLFYNGPLGGGSLYDLLEMVLEAAELPLTTAGEKPWVLWDGLADIHTAAPLPVDTGENLVKMLANAGCCVVYQDRQGITHVEPAPQEDSGFYMPYRQMTQAPEVETDTTFSRVDVRAYKYNDPGAATTIHEETYAVNGASAYRVNVDFGAPCMDVRLTATGGAIVSQTVYARALVCTITGSGNVTLKATGRRIEASYTLASSAATRPGPNAKGRVLDNPLITSPARAKIVADWLRDELQKRLSYTYTSRGCLNIDPLDILHIQTPYSRSVPVRVRRHEWTIDQKMKDTTKARGG